MSRPVRVLLLWPGCEGAAAGNFGVPQLVGMATYVRRETSAAIDVRDLAAEAAFGAISFEGLLAGDDGRGYDVIGFSVYSSFDHLKCMALAELARTLYPDAVIVAGGYHPSARPYEYVRDGSPFDVCVVGEGERPLCRIVESVSGGAPLRDVVLGPDAITDLDALPPTDWSFLARYRGVARRVASQAQVYLSRGCPFDCAFCMERAKREVSWRSFSVERAVEEVERLHRFLDLRGWTLYFADALFGMRKSWRRQFLEALAQRGFPVEKYWLLIRVDLVEDRDLELFSRANCGLGFGLESGDPGLLSTIRKTGRLDDYLERMRDIAERAREHDVPWGANVICGHPGETPQSMARSASYLADLFGSPRGTTGFLSVDPFRLYPGSPIDADRGAYERRFGTRFHRPVWWEDGDPAFLAEWIDPSAELDYLEREALQHELLLPILSRIDAQFVYRGSAREYFRRAIAEQVRFAQPSSRIRELERYYAWMKYLGRSTVAERGRPRDAALREVCRALRAERLPAVAEAAELDPIDPIDPIIPALERVPRELFVPLDQIAASVKDVAIALDDAGLATVSAMHAYARSFGLAEIASGDRVVDLGAGTGYGSSLLRELVGSTGKVTAVEFDRELYRTARRNLVGTGIRFLHADALALASWRAWAGSFDKVVVGFAMPELPAGWAREFAEGTIVVAPVVRDGVTRLVRAVVRDQRFDVTEFEAVHYVPVRRPAVPRVEPSPAPRVRLELVR